MSRPPPQYGRVERQRQVVRPPRVASQAGRIDSMYVIAIAWLYVIVVVSVANPTVVGGVLTFVFAGLGPLALFLWLAGTPARRRAAARRETSTGTVTNDRAESGQDQ